MGTWLAEQWAKSTIISGTLALSIWWAIIYLAVNQAPVPEILYYAGATIIGFFFGAKSGELQAQAAAQKTASPGLSDGP